MNNNKVEILGHYGSDLVHAQSAWTSTSRDLSEEKISRMPKLLKMLAENGHHTPFEKSSFHFLITVEQASHIHVLKHRIGTSVNGESARYKELKEDKFYLPEDWNGYMVCNDILDSHGNLIAHGQNENGSTADTWYEKLKEFSELGNKLYHECLNDLTPVLGRKRAKESARFFKNFNSQITLDVMFNWRSFYHFYNLRAKDDAQIEIQDIAKEMLRLIKEIDGNPFEHTLLAFGL